MSKTKFIFFFTVFLSSGFVFASTDSSGVPCSATDQNKTERKRANKKADQILNSVKKKGHKRARTLDTDG